MAEPITLPEDVRELAELLASRLNIAPGRLTLHLDKDGRLVDCFAEHRLKPTLLEHIPVESAAGS